MFARMFASWSMVVAFLERPFFHARIDYYPTKLAASLSHGSMATQALVTQSDSVKTSNLRLYLLRRHLDVCWGIYSQVISAHS